MTPGGSPHPQGWAGDPVVDAGFAAAYAPVDGDVLTVPSQATAPDRAAAAPQDAAPGVAPSGDVPASPAPEAATTPHERDLRADLAARRPTVDGRRVRAAEPARLSPARALAGAAVSVAGVCLGIVTLLWVSDDPSQGPGPVVGGPVEVASGRDGPSEPAALPDVATAPLETEVAPVDPPSPDSAVPSVAAAPAGPRPSAAAPSAAAPSLVVPVTVLNNSNRTGLADRAARRFAKGGWPVRLTGNFRGQIPVTTVYYDPGLEASARAFADAFDGIARVRPRFATLPARGVVVVLTREFAS